MTRALLVCVALLLGTSILPPEAKKPSYPSFDYEAARTHEIKPHRRTIPLDGVSPGFNQLHLTLTVSAAGDVIEAEAGKDSEVGKFWPELEGEVRQWKFTPFEKDGKAVTAQIEEYLDLVPPERLPKKHVAAPVLRQDSKIAITLRRTGCFGTCPSYKVVVSTEGIVFDGGGNVVASGVHRDTVEASKVRELAQRFVSADFYSMDDVYRAGVTDNPTYVLSIAIDGRSKSVEDYVGEWEGMPAVISELEEAVDEFAQTQRWIKGTEGLVEGLQAEKFDFKTFDAQVMLKEAATRGESETVQSLLEAGLPLKPLPAPKPKEKYMAVPFDHVGWLTAASSDPKTLQVLIDAAASKSDQRDKDLALLGAARSGEVEAVRALIAYGANPNADLSKETVTESGAGMTLEFPSPGSVLIDAAGSGDPEVVKEILRYHPKLEARDREGKTALFAAGDYRSRDVDGARVECVRLLVEAGADVNARDRDGNTPLHEIFLTDVEEELLKLGADVNARNNDGETPIFTTVDDDAIPLLIAHGADLAIRNKKGQTVVEAAEEKGPQRQEALCKAIDQINQR
jgi:ankyrin repeat protein